MSSPTDLETFVAETEDLDQESTQGAESEEATEQDQPETDTAAGRDIDPGDAPEDEVHWDLGEPTGEDDIGLYPEDKNCWDVDRWYEPAPTEDSWEPSDGCVPVPEDEPDDGWDPGDGCILTAV